MVDDFMYERLERMKMRLVNILNHLGDIDEDLDGDDRIDSIMPGGAYQRIEQAIGLLTMVMEE